MAIEIKKINPQIERVGMEEGRGFDKRSLTVRQEDAKEQIRVGADGFLKDPGPDDGASGKIQDLG